MCPDPKPTQPQKKTHKKLKCIDTLAQLRASVGGACMAHSAASRSTVYMPIEYSEPTATKKKSTKKKIPESDLQRGIRDATFGATLDCVRVCVC